MVDITCTRCGAEGTGYPTNYVAKFSLQHNTGCGARVGIPSYTAKPKPTIKEVEPVIHEADKSEKLFSDVVKAKKKRLKKTDHSAQ